MNKIGQVTKAMENKCIKVGREITILINEMYFADID
jgi:hypothetical protein